jgi:hypothetical protein
MPTRGLTRGPTRGDAFRPAWCVTCNVPPPWYTRCLPPLPCAPALRLRLSAAHAVRLSASRPPLSSHYAPGTLRRAAGPALRLSSHPAVSGCRWPPFRLSALRFNPTAGAREPCSQQARGGGGSAPGANEAGDAYPPLDKMFAHKTPTREIAHTQARCGGNSTCLAGGCDGRVFSVRGRDVPW